MSLSGFLRRNLARSPRFLGLQFGQKLHHQAKHQKAASVGILQSSAAKEAVSSRAHDDSAAIADVGVDSAYEKIDLSFGNAAECFKSKTNRDLIRALMVFNMCSIGPLVEKNKEVRVTKGSESENDSVQLRPRD